MFGGGGDSGLCLDLGNDVEAEIFGKIGPGTMVGD